MKCYHTRNLLHKSKLNAFADWLVENGYTVVEPKGDYEVLRAVKENAPVIIYTRQKAKEHYTVQGKDYSLVKQFIMERKNDS